MIKDNSKNVSLLQKVAEGQKLFWGNKLCSNMCDRIQTLSKKKKIEGKKGVNMWKEEEFFNCALSGIELLIAQPEPLQPICRLEG